MPLDDPAFPPGKNSVKRESALRIFGVVCFQDWMCVSVLFASWIGLTSSFRRSATNHFKTYVRRLLFAHWLVLTRFRISRCSIPLKSTLRRSATSTPGSCLQPNGERIPRRGRSSRKRPLNSSNSRWASSERLTAASACQPDSFVADRASSSTSSLASRPRSTTVPFSSWIADTGVSSTSFQISTSKILQRARSSRLSSGGDETCARRRSTVGCVFVVVAERVADLFTFGQILRLHRPFMTRGYNPDSKFCYSAEQCVRSAKIVITSVRDLAGPFRQLRR